MTEKVLLAVRHLGERATGASNDENRVVAEAVVAARRESDGNPGQF